MTEEWKVVPDYPDYEVSNLGRVRKTLIGHQDKSGVWRVSLANGRGMFWHPKLDALVWLAFRDVWNPKLTHIDGDRDNNKLENLE